MSGGELAAVISAAAALLVAIITMLVTAVKVGRLSGMMEQSIAAQNTMISDLKTDLKRDVGRLGDVVTTMAVQAKDISTLSEGLQLLRTQVNELAHGQGFVVPLEGVRSPAR